MCFFLDYCCLLLAILCFILYLNNNGLPLSPQQPQEANSWPDCGHDQNIFTGWTMNCWLLYTCIVLECGSVKPQTHNLYHLCGLTGSWITDHYHLSLNLSVDIADFHLWPCFVTFGDRSPHLAYHMLKSGRKTSIIHIFMIWCSPLIPTQFCSD